MRKSILKTILCLFLLGIILNKAAYAENYVDGHGYRVHYSSFPSNTLAAEQAKHYGIKRSNKTGILLVTPQVQPKENEDIGPGVKANVKASIRNLVDQKRELKFKQISEAGRYYYLANFTYVNEETFRFSVEVQAEGSSEALNIKFIKKFYVD